MSAVPHDSNFGTSASTNPNTKTGDETNKVAFELQSPNVTETDDYPTEEYEAELANIEIKQCCDIDFSDISLDEKQLKEIILTLCSKKVSTIYYAPSSINPPYNLTIEIPDPLIIKSEPIYHCLNLSGQHTISVKTFEEQITILLNHMKKNNPDLINALCLPSSLSTNVNINTLWVSIHGKKQDTLIFKPSGTELAHMSSGSAAAAGAAPSVALTFSPNHSAAATAADAKFNTNANAATSIAVKSSSAAAALAMTDTSSDLKPSNKPSTS